MPLRVSPRLSESQKRKRTAAPRAGGPGGPGAAAMAALTEASPAEAGEPSTAGEPSAAGEAAEGADAETQELENLELGGMRQRRGGGYGRDRHSLDARRRTARPPAQPGERTAMHPAVALHWARAGTRMLEWVASSKGFI